jgi:hypothetical protein
VFVTAAIMFFLLRSSDFGAVDGGLRSIDVYRTQAPYLHPSNHMLFPVNVYWWTELLRVAGLTADGPIQFLRLAQAMNGIAAAGVLGLLYGAVRLIGLRVGFALLITASYGLSRAFVAHATTGAEAMVGLFWSAVAIALVVAGSAQGKYWLQCGGGVVFALAMATYQSMVLIAPAVVVLAWRWPGSEAGERRSRVLASLAIAAGFLAGLVTIYGIAYYWSGTRDVASMIRRFAHVEASHAYGGVTPLKTVSVLPGLGYALFPSLPAHCDGFRCLVETGSPYSFTVATLATLLSAVWATAIVLLTVTLWKKMEGVSKITSLSCAAGLLCTGVPLLYWLPTYDKLWLQPLACLIVASAVVLKTALDASTVTPRRIGNYVPLLAILVVAWNLPVAMTRHNGPVRHLTEATHVAQIVGPADLLVGDWNGIFGLYSALWANPGRTFNLATEASLSGAAALRRLGERIEHTHLSGGRVFFLGVVDISQDQWHGSSIGRHGIPYDSLRQYRCCTEPVRELVYLNTPIPIRQLVRVPSDHPQGRRSPISMRQHLVPGANAEHTFFGFRFVGGNS